jgi:hypothetical protein
MVLVDDTSTTSGAMAYLIQPGINYAFNDNISLKSALTYEYFQTKDSAATSYSKGDNTRNGTTASSSVYGNYTYNYSVLNPALELTIKEPFKALRLNVENLKLFAEYVNNFSISKKNTGFSVGFQFGNGKIGSLGTFMQCLERTQYSIYYRILIVIAARPASGAMRAALILA